MFDTPAPIARLTDALRRADAAMVDAVEELIAARAQVTAESGLSMAVWLSAVSKLPKEERTRLLVAADVLPSLPQVRARFVDRAVAWPVVSRICSKAARLNASEQVLLDGRMADAIDHLAGDCTADAILDVLWEVAHQLRASRERDREGRLERGEFLALQPFLDGSGGSLYGELGAVNFAAVSDAVRDAAPMPDTSPNPLGDPQVTADNRRSIAQARAEGLVALCTRQADGRPARPKVLATVSMETLLGLHRASADLLTRLVGGRLHLTAVAARKLVGQGADLRLIVHETDGSTVGVGKQNRVPPDWLKDAVLAWHATCVCPGCNLPARDCDIDHSQEVRDGGRTDAGKLAPLHRGRHSQKTARRCTIDLAPDLSATWTDTRTGVSVTQPSLWTIKALASGTHPANRRAEQEHRRRSA